MASTIINAKRQCETCARLFPRVCRNEFTLAYYNVNSRLARARVINSISFCHAFVPPPPAPRRQIEFHSFTYPSVLGPVKKPGEKKGYLLKVKKDIRTRRVPSIQRILRLNIVSFELLTRDNSMGYQKSIDRCFRD